MSRPGLLARAGRGFWQSALTVRCRRAMPAELAAPAFVFAPHPDDETLGCGGTILRKRAAGADVQVVFLTDGSSSHRTLMDPVELVSLRRREALAACGALQVPAEAVHFLEFPDGSLSDHVGEAVIKVVALLSGQTGAEVFFPSRLDPPEDHLATGDIVTKAMSILPQTEAPAMVNEYPVWALNHWPHVLHRPARRLHLLQRPVSGMLAGARFFSQMNWAVDIHEFLALKETALACHASQMVRRDGNEKWPVLGDVADGTFLEALLQPRELFRRYTLKRSGTR